MLSSEGQVTALRLLKQLRPQLSRKRAFRVGVPLGSCSTGSPGLCFLPSVAPSPGLWVGADLPLGSLLHLSGLSAAPSASSVYLCASVFACALATTFSVLISVFYIFSALILAFGGLNPSSSGTFGIAGKNSAVKCGSKADGTACMFG